MKISWVCLSLFLGLLKVYGQPVQVSANDLLVEADLIEAAKQHFLHNTDKAVAIYEKLLKDHPDNDLADYYLAIIYQDSARWEKAVFHGLSAVKNHPGIYGFSKNWLPYICRANSLNRPFLFCSFALSGSLKMRRIISY